MYKNNIILDCDTGEDDALAIMVAIANKLPLKYVVSSYGNTTIENSTRNASRILSLMEASSVSVIKGASQPLRKHPFEKEMTAGEFVGKNGICNARLPKSKYKNIIAKPEKKRISYLASVIKKETPVTYIVTGPCTNFARLCKELGPDIKKYVSALYIMGAALDADGNSGPQHPKTGKSSAEFNFYCDPFAADIVLNSGIPIYLISWDVTSTLTVAADLIKKFTPKNQIGKFIIHLMRSFFKYYGFKYYRNFELNDPITVLAYMGYGGYREEKIRIVKRGRQYGRSVRDKKGVKVNYFKIEDSDKQVLIEKVLKDISIEF